MRLGAMTRTTARFELLQAHAGMDTLGRLAKDRYRIRFTLKLRHPTRSGWSRDLAEDPED